MSLKRNILASYASQVFVTAVGILILPIYIQYMGAEAYGLVGFFTLMQSWFGLLDLGLTPTIGRETARYQGGAISALAYSQLFRALSLIFATVALLGGGGLWLLSGPISTRWLNVAQLPLNEVVLAVQIMAVSVALRWMGGLYRGVVSGSERLVWLSGFNALIATMRFIAVLPSMWLFGFTPFIFFAHQFVVALIEIVGLYVKSRHLLPPRCSWDKTGGGVLEPIRPLLKFSLSVAFTSSVWVLVTQTDKLILSGILPLVEYGYFTLAVLVASGILVVSGPVSGAIMPRMARLHAEGNNEELVRVYRSATKLVTVIGGSAAIVLAFCSQPLLYAWTGDLDLATKAAPIMRLYAIGNGLLAVGAFPYYLQYAKGNLRYHLIGNAVSVAFLLPVIIIAAKKFGGVGAGYAWLIFNGTYMVTWVAYVHHKFEPGLYCKWLLRDILGIFTPAVVLVSIISVYEPHLGGRVASLGYVIFIGCMAVIPSVLAMRLSKIGFVRS